MRRSVLSPTRNDPELLLGQHGRLRLRLRVRLVAVELEPGNALELACRPGFFDAFEGTGAERLSPPSC